MKNLILFIFLLSFLFSCDDSRTGDYAGVMYNSDSAKSDYAKGNFRVLTYGSESLYLSTSKYDSIARTFGFHYEYQGQRVPANFTEGMDVYNKTMDSLLEKKNGKGWEARLAQQFKSLTK